LLPYSRPVKDETAESHKVDLDKIIDDKGYIKIDSEVVGEVICLAKDQRTLKMLEQRMKTERWPETYVIYTLQEVGELIKDHKISPEGLNRIHAAKKVFGSSGSKIIDTKNYYLKRGERLGTTNTH